jgi:hypothetical protein
MKVTDAVLDAVARGLEELEYETPYRDARPMLRRVLEAALADVPDPRDYATCPIGSIERDERIALDRAEAAEARIAELEAELAQARGLADVPDPAAPAILMEIVNARVKDANERIAETERRCDWYKRAWQNAVMLASDMERQVPSAKSGVTDGHLQGPFGDGGMGAHLDEKRSERIAELEAELAKVRALADDKNTRITHEMLYAIVGEMNAGKDE